MTTTNKRLFGSALLGCVLPVLMLCSLTAAADIPSDTKLTLSDCHLDGIRSQVKCGHLQVPENYSKNKPTDAQLAINFAILPAIDNSENKAPLMFLAGGPGQAAVELAAGLNKVFREIRKTRDIILVDQRGTGQSHPLECPGVVEPDIYQTTPEDYSEADVKACLAEFKGDLSQFNSQNAIRDFDAVREALGHQQINLYGGSYGTRAGLVYMRMFPKSIRSIVLDSVGPIEVPIGLFGQSSARSFEFILTDCEKEAACKKAFPNLKQEFEQLLTRLEQNPVTVNIAHPRLGTQTPFKISGSKLIGHIRMQLYSVSGRSLVPLVIHQAYNGNYLPLAGLIATTDGGVGVYTGLLFNIACNEDFPRINAQMFAKDAQNNFGGKDSHQSFKDICPIWPQYRPSEAFYQPVTANIPTLILSGDLDPVTPPSNGEYPAKTLPNSHHIVVKNVSHGVATSSCASDIMNEFLTTLDPKSLDVACLDDIPQASFMTSLNGGS